MILLAWQPIMQISLLSKLPSYWINSLINLRFKLFWSWSYSRTELLERSGSYSKHLKRQNLEKLRATLLENREELGVGDNTLITDLAQT